MSLDERDRARLAEAIKERDDANRMFVRAIERKIHLVDQVLKLMALGEWVEAVEFIGKVIDGQDFGDDALSEVWDRAKASALAAEAALSAEVEGAD